MALATPEQRAVAFDQIQQQQVAQFREQLAEAMAHAVVDDSIERRSQYLEQLKQTAEDWAINKPAGHWQDLAALLWACIALLQGQAYDPNTLLEQDYAQALIWQAQYQPI